MLPSPAAQVSSVKSIVSRRPFLVGTVFVILWIGLYSQLHSFSLYLVYTVFDMEKGNPFAKALQFFIYDTPKVLLLLVLVIFFVGIARTFFTQERTRKYLAGRRETAGNVMASLLGIVTPFCSCSAVPLFIGFVQAGVPLGVTFSFLIAAPLVNEVALVLLYGLLGWKVAALYLGSGLLIAVISGWIIGRLKLEVWVEDWVQEERAGQSLVFQPKFTWQDRAERGVDAVVEIVGKVWMYIVAGIAVGAVIHGYVPEDFMAAVMGKEAWFSVPLAVLLGVPMYSNAAGVVPVLEALLDKGAALGTALAFMMSVTALSLPEMIILRKALKPKLIAVFITVVGLGILCTGYLFTIYLDV